MHPNVCTIFHKLFVTFTKLPPLAGVTCYSRADCTGDVVEAPGLTIKDCCVGTNGGQSFADSSGTCIEDQCVGKRIRFPYLMFIATYNQRGRKRGGRGGSHLPHFLRRGA